MIPKADIEFREADTPIREAVTKFGGQPAWIETPAWPLSRQTGRPMRFIAQVALEPDLFGTVPARMAYLFMTDDDEGEWVDGTYEPDGGENAVVLQPGDFTSPTTSQAEGPTLVRMIERPGEDRLVPEPCEFAASLVFGEDTDNPNPDGYPNQIGGIPTFLQGEEYPKGGPWRLLLQLDSSSVPFCVNFGDAGVGYAFVSRDGTAGKFLWQCS